MAQQKYTLVHVAAALQLEGVTAECHQWQATARELSVPAHCARAVLILPEQGASKLGEPASIVRRRLGEATEVWACVPHLTNADVKLLLGYGVSNIFSPRSWSPSDVAERILAELISCAQITPAACSRMRGASRQMRALYAHINKLAGLKDPVLISGETGTGKELVAEALHQQGNRKGELVAINCAELSGERLISDLFGHKQGAFTDARQDRKGLLTEVGFGTFFFDEVGELDLDTQAQLLRVLEKREFRPLGKNEVLKLNARLVLATNRDLEVMCQEGRFRRDLFERINDYSLSLPPLRERRADLVLLAQHFISEYNDDERPTPKRQAPTGAFDCLFQSDWEGNVRALRKAVRRAATYADDEGWLSVVSLQESAQARVVRPSSRSIPFDPANDTWRAFSQRTQSAYFRALQAHTAGNKDLAIRISGLSRSRFYEVLKELAQLNGDDQVIWK